MEKSLVKRYFAYFLFGSLIFIGLYFSSLYNYLLFHSLAEIFSILIAFGIFMVAWNSRQFTENAYFLFIGVAYFFVGGLDLVHTLSYKGMAIFQGTDTNLPTQLWIAARYLEALSFLLAPLLVGRKLRPHLVFLGYSTVFVLLLLSIFRWKIFPACFIEGVGLTPFKKTSEFVISGFLGGAIGLLLRKRGNFDRSVLRWLIGSIVLTIASEMSFTYYIDVYGLSNLIGHYLKILSFYFIYKAIIEMGLRKPYALLFRDLKESEERYRSLFANMINGFARHRVLFDETGKPIDYVFLDVNEAFERLTGLKRETLLGRRVTEIIPGIEKDPAGWIGIYGRVAMTGEPACFDSYAKNLERWYSVLAYSTEEGYFTTIFEDITDRKEAENQLKKRAGELEAANRELDAFNSLVSHDLKNQLIIIAVLIKRLFKKDEADLDAQGRKYLDLVNTSVENMLGLVDDLLDLSRVSKIKVNIEEVDLAELAGEVLKGLREKDPDRRVIAGITEKLMVRGDRRLLQVALDNLLSNAWKFTKNSHPARIEFGVAEAAGKRSFFIRDNGCGFEVPAKMDEVFLPFQRYHPADEYPGTGVGLATVKRIIDRHGGSIRVESNVGVGTTFYFTL
jgi:signal transduction histidine kinase